ncbi:MAG: DUF1540 domain-containing protein [Christensenellales bacterium]
MQHSRPNRSIGCTVTNCKYHAGDEQYCALNSIMVGSHQDHPVESESVDCESFEVK